eukprot:TRINITY_DN40188_c0_g1_i1.p1 TRINITY_DN40188_c0_g1~~TRINITY_DN40188_c0_g1_i1.p1  ORF type:complete len:437 (+),score=102.82 TRINITY_DN40188_c0_g1_i1:67-1377(+)
MRGVATALALLLGASVAAAVALGPAHEAVAERRLEELLREFAELRASASALLNDTRSRADAHAVVSHHGSGDTERPLLLFYETDYNRAILNKLLLKQVSSSGFEVKTLGLSQSFSGFGTKHRLVQQELAKAHPDRLVVVSDYEDVVFNPRSGADEVKRFKEKFERITRGASRGAVVVSGEHQCCVASLTYHSPGDIIAANGTRLARVCSSWRPKPGGGYTCTGVPFGNLTWMHFMDTLARDRNGSSGYNYLNAGLLAGRASDVARLISAMQIGDEEDDQAVMTDLLFRRPDSIVIDYNQELFANMRHVLGEVEGCVLNGHTEGATQYFQQRETGSVPMFLHFPSKHINGCMRRVASFVAKKVEALLLQELSSFMGSAAAARHKSSFLATRVSVSSGGLREALRKEVMRELEGTGSSSGKTGSSALVSSLLHALSVI